MEFLLGRYNPWNPFPLASQDSADGAGAVFWHVLALWWSGGGLDHQISYDYTVVVWWSGGLVVRWSGGLMVWFAQERREAASSRKTLYHKIAQERCEAASS